MAPGALRPLSTQYALSPRLQQHSPPGFAGAPSGAGLAGPVVSGAAYPGPAPSTPAFAAPAPPPPAFAAPAPSAPGLAGPASSTPEFSAPASPPAAARSGYTQPPAGNVSARGGTLPPGLVSQQDVLSTSGVYSASGLPFISAPPPSDPAPPSQMSFQPAPNTERMLAANAAQPPPPAAPPAFAGPGFGPAGPPVHDAGRTPLPSLHAGVPAPAGPPSPAASAPAPAPAMGVAPAVAPGAPPAGGAWDGASAAGAPHASGGWDGAAAAGAPQAAHAAMPPAESPWATTSARLELPALPSSFVQERAEPQKPPAVTAPRREGGRTLIIVLSVILAIALLALVGITLWQSMGGGGPIAIDYTEPPPTTAETAAEPTPSATAAPAATAAPRPAARPRPKGDDIYDEIDKEKTRR
ncbi:hypothetical protein [Sorangium sp. So ce385]|uniref:hypothetical protein n=1 Tax=Sorangium sp. So ce385 TaxID=3133308 RepID=UPI003F5AEED6